MWWCCGSAEAEEARGSKLLANGENGAYPAGNGHASDGGKENGLHESLANGKRRDSVESEIFFDAEEFFIDEDSPAYLPPNGVPGTVSGAEEVVANPSTAAVQKSKEGLALEEIRTSFAKYNLPDATYCRFLRARHWDVKKASKLIQGYLEWREEMKPSEIVWNDISEEFETGKVFRLGLVDKKNGRHVVILRPGKQNTKNHVAQMKQLVYTMESAIALKGRESLLKMDNPPVRTLPQDQLIVLLDFTGYTMRNAPSLKSSLETLKILQDYYCERLGEALLLNPPSVFRFLWKLIRPFIDKRTLAKINFLPKSFVECDLLKERFDLEDLDASLGGTGDHPFDFEKYGALMMEEDRKRLLRPISVWTPR